MSNTPRVYVAGHRGMLGSAIVRSAAPKVTIWGTGTPKREFLYVEDWLRQACMS